jgi:hypothetical protein
MVVVDGEAKSNRGIVQGISLHRFASCRYADASSGVPR